MYKIIGVVVCLLTLCVFSSAIYAGQPAAEEVKQVNVSEKKININSADEAQLQNLPGIGEKTANSIVSYRTENGKFKKVEDLMKKIKRGLGEEKCERIFGNILLE